MKNIELNQEVVSKVIAFKMLEILRDNNMLNLSKYKAVELQRIRYSENIIKRGKNYKGGN